MGKSKFARHAAGVVITGALLVSGSSYATAQAPQSSRESIARAETTATAQAFFQHRANLLVDNPARVSPPLVAPAFKATYKVETTALLARKQQLSRGGESYSRAQSTVKSTAFRLMGDSAKATIEESTILWYAHRESGTPENTAYREIRDVTFVRTSDGWAIAGQKSRGAGLPAITDVMDRPTPSSSTEATLPKASKPASTEKPANALFNAGDHDKDKSARGYNYGAMVWYAYNYAWSYNSSYRRFPGVDCTNFILQAVAYGGWGHVGGWYNDAHYWWYNWANQSTSWINAHYWWWFARYNGRTTLLSNLYYMLPSDVMQADWNGYTGGLIPEHTMMVTAKSGSELYLSYHSTDTRNRSLYSILVSSPGAAYWAHRT